MDPEPPLGWVELLTTNDWNVMSGKGGVLIISDTANDGPIYHDRGCPFAEPVPLHSKGRQGHKRGRHAERTVLLGCEGTGRFGKGRSCL